MEVRKQKWWMGLTLVILLSAVGCAGILQESYSEDGKAERLRIQGGESWRSWDRNPTKGDASGLMLMKQATF